MISQGNEPGPVWPCAEGRHRGIAFEPLYPSAPLAALRDPTLYEYLALADALRDGRPRERRIAQDALHSLFRDADAPIEH